MVCMVSKLSHLSSPGSKQFTAVGLYLWRSTGSSPLRWNIYKPRLYTGRATSSRKAANASRTILYYLHNAPNLSILTLTFVVNVPLQSSLLRREHSHWITVFLVVFFVYMYPFKHSLTPPLLLWMISIAQPCELTNDLRILIAAAPSDLSLPIPAG